MIDWNIGNIKRLHSYTVRVIFTDRKSCLMPCPSENKHKYSLGMPGQDWTEYNFKLHYSQ